MTVVRANERPLAGLDFAGVYARKLLDAEAGAGAVTLGELVLDPGSELPRHRHRVEEAFLVIEGRGTLYLGDETLAVAAGDALLAPAWSVHGFRNDSDGPFRLAFFYPAVEPWSEFV